MKVQGIFTNRGKGTLYLSGEFDTYYNSPENGRTAVGELTKSVYVGALDISKLNVGDEIEIFYGEPILTKNGTFAPIRKIERVK